MPTTTSAPLRSRPLAFALFTACALILLPACATFGEYDSDQGFGIGVRGQVPLERVSGADDSRFELAGDLHLFSPSEGSLVIGSADVILPAFRLAEGNARSYVGGGVHLGRLSPDVGDSNYRAGINLIGGVRFQRRAFAPFAEVRGGLGGYSSLSALVGVRLFGPGD